ncbi:RNA-binding protein with serine-rich domain 1 [Babesia ovis]|uniref:RNA-binding protein with serine-rich domain 1 n=1 Tax=Babesia ovis TaxID=5869 RepID=A0A9W5T8Z1_BABOV|nr:RNA-binding protein with serine-rich domain 1 [Babesia ovis]
MEVNLGSIFVSRGPPSTNGKINVLNVVADKVETIKLVSSDRSMEATKQNTNKLAKHEFKTANVATAYGSITVGNGPPKYKAASKEIKRDFGSSNIIVGRCPPDKLKNHSATLEPGKTKAASTTAKTNDHDQNQNATKEKAINIRKENEMTEILRDLVSSDSFAKYTETNEHTTIMDNANEHVCTQTSLVDDMTLRTAVSVQTVKPASVQNTDAAHSLIIEANTEPVSRRGSTKSVMDNVDIAMLKVPSREVAAEVPLLKHGTQPIPNANEVIVDQTMVPAVSNREMRNEDTIPEQQTPSARVVTDATPKPTRNKLDAFRRVANKFKMISRMVGTKDDELLPMDAYGYAMRHSSSNVSDRSFFHSRRASSVNSDKLGSMVITGDERIVASKHDIGRRAGLRLEAINRKYNRLNEAIEGLSLENEKPMKNIDLSQPKPTVSSLWSKHGSSAVLRRSDPESIDENLPALYSVYVIPLSVNVTADHLREIMINFGEVRSVDIEPIENCHDRLVGKVVYEAPEGADKALKHMDKGEIDGLKVRVLQQKPANEELLRMIK